MTSGKLKFLTICIFTCLYLMSGGSAFAATGDVVINIVETTVTSGSSFEAEIEIDAGTNALGAYDLTITYGSSIVNIQSISGGSTSEFSSTPTYNSATFTSGSTDINGINSSSMVSPTGSVDVANVRFSAVGLGNTSTNICITVNSLVDTDGFDITPINPICTKVTLIDTVLPATGANNLWVLLLAIGLLFAGCLILYKRGKAVNAIILQALKLFSPVILLLTFFLALILAMSIGTLTAFANTGAVPAITGDANNDGVVNGTDVTLIRRYVSGLEQTLVNPEAADVNGDGNVTIGDAQAVSFSVSGISSALAARPNMNLVRISSPDASGDITIEGLPGAASGCIGGKIIAIDTANKASDEVLAQADGSFAGVVLSSTSGRSIKVICDPPDTLLTTPRTTAIILIVPGASSDPIINRTGQAENPPSSAVTSESNIKLYSGEFEFSVTDLNLKSRGYDLDFSRTYKSQIDYDGPLGYNWDLNYNRRLVKSSPSVALSDIKAFNGGGRGDTYTYSSPGNYSSPTGFFTRLIENPGGTFTLLFPDGTREVYRGFNGSRSQGKLLTITDQNRNQMRFTYDTNGRLSVITDTLGRKVTLTYNSNNRIAKLTDFTGRAVSYSYDSLGNLIARTTPTVTGTITNNNFALGKTTRYAYSSGDGDYKLNHNLVTVTSPKEVASGGNPYLRNYYNSSDKVSTQDIGGTNETGIASGGMYAFRYASYETGATDPNVNFASYDFNGLGLTIQDEIITRGIRPSDPASFIISYDYDGEGRQIRVTYPEGNQTLFKYSSTDANRLHQGNLIEEKKLPGPRGANQSSIITTYTYEPVFNRVKTVIDPRGNDPTFVPPIGSQSSSRYTTTYTYDYQEGSQSSNIASLAYAMGFTTADATNELFNYGISLGQTDINGDSLTNQVRGNVILDQQPTVSLPSNSSLISIEGDTTQEIIRRYTYNSLGQLIKETDPEGNVTEHSYYPVNDPDGDGSSTLNYRAGIHYRYASWGGLTGGGYLKSSTEDSSTSSRRRETAPPDKATHSYTYDTRGNVLAETDPNGNVWTYTYNQLDELIRENDPSPLGYYSDYYYDANSNLIEIRRQNSTISSSEASGLVAANSELSTLFSYDILDNTLSISEEISAGEVSTADLAIKRFRYDANENMTRQTEPAGDLTTYTYDERNHLYSVKSGSCDAGFRSTCNALTLPNQPVASRDYDKNGNMTREYDAEDNNFDGAPEVLTYSYDGYDRPLQVKDAAGGINDYSYDLIGNVLSKRTYGQSGGPTPGNDSGVGNLLLEQTEYKYDELNRTFRSEETVSGDPSSPYLRYSERDANDRLVRLVDPLGHYDSYTYDGMDRLVKERDLDGNQSEYTYDQNGNLKAAKDRETGLGLPDEFFTTGYQYDALDRLVRVTDNIGNTSRFFYDSRGNLVWESDAKGPLTADASGEFPNSTTPNGITAINSHGNTKKFTYDGLNRLVKEDNHLRQGGDGNGNLNPAGDLDTTNPDNSDGIISVIYGYNTNDLLISQTDDEGKMTSYVYDALARSIQHFNADGTAVTYGYDKDDHLIQQTDEKGTVVNYEYDGIDRTIQKTIIRAPGVVGTTQESYEYDGLGHNTFAYNNNGTGSSDLSQVNLQYDMSGRIIGESHSVGNLGARTVSSAYDVNSNRLLLTYPNGRKILSQYDQLDRLDVINNGQFASDPNVADYQYMGERITKRAHLNGTKLTMLNNTGNIDNGYDGIGRLIKMRNLTAGNNLVAGQNYDYDRVDNRRFEQRLHGDGKTDIYNFDSRYRMVANARDATSNNNQATAAYTDAYRYDGVGNRVTSTEDNVVKTYVHDQKNQYSNVGGTPTSSDSKGNLTTDGTYNYSYDYKSRLVDVKKASDESLVATYTYDSFNRRVKKDTPSETIYYYWDDWQLIEERDASDDVIAQYTYGNGIDTPLMMYTVGNTYYYHQNAQNNVIALTDASGDIVEGYRYKSFGEPTALIGRGADNIWFTSDDAAANESSVGNRLTFAGREYDIETGLFYWRNRFYNPSLGRFFTRDPIGDWTDSAQNGNGFTYVHNNPVSVTDLNGFVENHNSSRSNRTSLARCEGCGSGYIGGKGGEGRYIGGKGGEGRYIGGKGGEGKKKAGGELGGAVGSMSDESGYVQNHNSSRSNTRYSMRGGFGDLGGCAENHNSSRSNIKLYPMRGGFGDLGGCVENHNSSRSNRTSLVRGGGQGDWGGCVQNHNSSRSNKSYSMRGGFGDLGGCVENHNSSRSNTRYSIRGYTGEVWNQPTR